MENAIGTLGEKIVAVWCAQTGLTAHRPDHDCFGWDYVVEYPNSFASHKRLLDSVPAPIEFRVQVKSTNGTSESEPIALSHLLRLAKLPMPVFFCFLVFDSKPEPVRVYLVHLGEDLISRALARARELSACGERDIHKRSLSIRFDASQEIEKPFWRAFKDRIDAQIGEGIEAYIAWKSHVLSRAGFNECRVTADVTFEPIAPDVFVDFFIGLKSSLDVREMIVREHRFGIAEEIEPSRRGPAKLSIEDHHPRTDCAVAFRKDNFSAPIEFPATWYAPPAPRGRIGTISSFAS
jgi:hypothetical protein